ncbi:MAG: methyltransferase domain-containing protein [Planctomycetes bacterium]|nr:methyltransferase domain-containing protein [Planctomycetota bacterium]
MTDSQSAPSSDAARRWARRGGRLGGRRDRWPPEREARSLRARMERRYPLAVREITIGERRFAITVVADPDQVLLEMERGIAHAGRDEPRWQPYWAESWESAIGLGTRLIERRLDGAKVLDLGCGIGLAGTVAASQGADVFFADAAPPALLFARWNAWPWRDRIRAARVDWQRDTLGESFDRILGADIVYDRHDWEHLDRFWRRHLTPGGSVLVGEPSRSGSNAFPSWMADRGWHCSGSEVVVEHRPRRIRIWDLSIEARRAGEGR